MQIETKVWTKLNGWQTGKDSNLGDIANIVFVFGDGLYVATPANFDKIRSFYPHAHIVLCSTAGEIQDCTVLEHSLALTAVSFEHTQTNVLKINIDQYKDSYEAGKSIFNHLVEDDLSHIFILSDGQKVNGSNLVEGINALNANNVPITGGLAGDGDRFKQTFVGLDDVPKEGNIVAVGYYGDRLKVGHASMGGWDPFGPERIVTKAEKNILFELDGQSALELYKKYLGDLSADLPGSALLFPLSIKLKDSEEIIVRTILSVDENNNSMVFAGDIPEGARARLMKANFDRLVDGATTAAYNCLENFDSFTPQLAFLISCVGRKLLLKERTEEEVESVKDVLGSNTVLSGFYSYGEISPVLPFTRCELHNQTMTITTYSEI